MDRRPDLELATLMRRQQGVLAQRQAGDVGLAASTMSMRLSRGRYRELLPGVVAEHGTPDSWQLRAAAAVAWAGGDAVLARGSAAVVHGWEVPTHATDAIHLLTRQRTRATPDGVVLHRSASFDRVADVHGRGMLSCTSPARTLVDLAAVLSTRELRDVVAQAVRQRQADASTITAALLRAGRVTGAGMLRAILTELSPLHAACRSWLESAYVDLTDGTGLEPTAVNHPVRDARGDRRLLDAVYLPEHLPIELDGAATHSTPLDIADDADREQQVVLAGVWRQPERFTYADVVDRGDHVLASVEAALRAVGSTRARRPRP